MLFKKRPVNSEGGGGRGKRTSSAAPSTPQPPPLHNGTDAPTFLKPDPLPSMTSQEYYEADEILKVLVSTYWCLPTSHDATSGIFLCDYWLVCSLSKPAVKIERARISRGVPS